MSIDKEDQITLIVLILGFVICLVVPEVLIFGFDQEARDDWTRMLIIAIVGPFMWIMAITCVCLGVLTLFEREFPLEPKIIIAFALCYPGARIPYYWIKRIVIDDVPAFGYNPDNIYAVAGINSMVLGFWWAIQGLIAGLVVVAVIWVIKKL